MTDKKKTQKTETLPAERQPEEKLQIRTDFATLYVKRFGGEIMAPIKGVMKLSESKGQIYKVKKSYAATIDGYKHMNKVAGISIVSPPKVSVGGMERANPYVDRNSESQAIQVVSIRKIGVGFNPAGNIVVVDKTLHYNIRTYLLQAIQSKMKKRKWDKKANAYSDEPLFENLAFMGASDERPEDGRWAFYLMEAPIGLWLNYEHKAASELFEDHVQRQKFAERIADTIVERNILKSHPAIGFTKVEVDNMSAEKKTATVTVWGWRHDHGPRDIQQIVKQADEGAQEIKVEAEEIKAEPDEEKEAIEQAEEDDENKADGSLFADPPDKKEREPGEEG